MQTYNISSIPGFNELCVTNDISNSNILKLNKLECRTNNSSYKVIRYDKNFLCIDLIPSYGLCRSVIVNSANRVVGFAPPKSIKADNFIEKYPELSSQDIIVQEFIEGTMINVFFDDSIGITGGWEISTRNTVGATSSFFKSPNSKTFRQMFMEAATECKLDINELNKDFSYSFVLQHPENRIVVPFSKPQLYLVAVYKIINGDTDNVSVECHNISEFKSYFHEKETTVKFPENYEFENYSKLIEKFGSMNTSYDVVGVVIHNTKTGERTKIRNPVYEQVRSLRGNQPKLQYQYLCLRKEGKVKDFLNYYSENKHEFSKFRDQVHLFTQTLYSNYVSCYIKKEKPLIEFSEQYRTHMFNIHKIYMNELREKKHFVNTTVVQRYVNDLHPSLLMYCLNFQMRKRNVDTIVADNNV
jgi:hypothetical protein